LRFRSRTVGRGALTKEKKLLSFVILGGVGEVA